MAGPKHSCGVVGLISNEDVAPSMYTALMVIQHRGQESAGISVFNGECIDTVKDRGLVDQAITGEKLATLKGNVGIGHVMYSTVGSHGIENAQPLTVFTKCGQVSVVHNGDITNFEKLKAKYLEEGDVFFSNTGAELVLELLGKKLKDSRDDPVKAIRAVMNELDGAYTFAILVNGRLFGVRDPYGFRPLCLGKVAGGHMIVSESCALDALRGEFIRDIQPGEIVEVFADGCKSYPMEKKQPRAMCMFEWVYFARPDSVIDGMGVYEARRRIGAALARESPVEADLVMPIPDSGRAHAIGYAIEAGIPYEEGFMKNRFAGRTFILPEQRLRENAVAMKMIPIKSTVAGKSIVIIDDSIVRGTTLKKLISMLREAGAAKVHVRVGSPPIIAPCFYGVDMTTRDQFIATTYSVEEIRQIIGADTLAYISKEGLVEALGFKEEDLCLACANALYPTDIEGEKHR